MAEVATIGATQRRAAGGTSPVLEVRELRTHFFTDEGVIRAVAGVSFRIGRGETLAVVGESGSGKSVTGLSIMGLLARTPARIVGGRIDFCGRDGRVRNLLELSEAELRRIRGREISMIFQDPTSSLNPVLSVGDQIAETIMLHQGKGRSEAMDLAARMLALVGIADPKRRVHDYPHQLSGGMRQRVMIGMALSCDPSLLIADEPTTALDVTIQIQIVDLLRRLQLERHMGMLFITHDLGLVAEIADRIAVMYAGQVVEEGPADAVLTRPRHPYTLALLECIPERDYAGGGRSLRPIPGTVPDPLHLPQGCRFHPRCRLAVAACRAGEIALEQVRPGHGSRCIRWQELG
jgi:peptide/nickel transport system ATP-binding protein/oligopeptide transport system ATP-binding protein